MPLLDDVSQEGTESNIRELAKSGYPPKRRVAIALSHRRELLKKRKAKK